MDAVIQEKVSQKANELTATYDEKIRNYEDRYDAVLAWLQCLFTGYRREQDLQRQLSLTKDQLRDLRVSNENNQAKLFDHSQRQGMQSPLISSLSVY